MDSQNSPNQLQESEKQNSDPSMKQGFTLSRVPTWLLSIVMFLIIGCIAGVGVFLLNGVISRFNERTLEKNWRQTRSEAPSVNTLEASEQEENQTPPESAPNSEEAIIPEDEPPKPTPPIYDIDGEDVNILFFTQLMDKYLDDASMQFNYTWAWDSEFYQKDIEPSFADFVLRDDVNISIEIEFPSNDDDFVIPEEKAKMIIDDIFEEYGYNGANYSIIIADEYYYKVLMIIIIDDYSYIYYAARIWDDETDEFVTQYEAEYSIYQGNLYKYPLNP
jgi:hypothetical protein